MFYDSRLTAPIQPELPTPGVLDSYVPDEDPRNWWQRNPKLSRVIQAAVPFINTQARLSSGLTGLPSGMFKSNQFVMNEIQSMNLPGHYAPRSVGGYIESRLQGKPGYFSKRYVVYFSDNPAGSPPAASSPSSSSFQSGQSQQQGQNKLPSGQSQQQGQNKPQQPKAPADNRPKMAQPSPPPSPAKEMQKAGNKISEKTTEQSEAKGAVMDESAEHVMAADNENSVRNDEKAEQDMNKVDPKNAQAQSFSRMRRLGRWI